MIYNHFSELFNKRKLFYHTCFLLSAKQCVGTIRYIISFHLPPIAVKIAKSFEIGQKKSYKIIGRM